MFAYGVDYYPEQWPETRWPEDARLMREAGIRVVRLAEFAWTLIEPEEGRFEWAWLDRAFDALAAEGLRFVLCTPTPTPPAWLTQRYPDTLRVNETGTPMHAGTRRHACANAPDYRRLALRVAEQMAMRYGHDDRVVAWQSDNEYGCHDTIRCICAHCEHAFQAWLEGRYGTLDALNEAWGTVFWSQRYSDWTQIEPPRDAPTDHNPALVLDFYRFSSETWIEFNREQVALLRRHAPDHLVTHNLMIYFFHLDHYRLARDLDFVSWDNYHHHGAAPVTVAANHALMWGAKERNFWVIEQQVGQVNWSAYNPQFSPGMLTLKALQAVAHGADGLLYFRWRQARFGAEMMHGGLLDHAARPTRALGEARALGAEWEALAEALEGTTPYHDAAILFDFDSHWALDIQPHSLSLVLRWPERQRWTAPDAPADPLLDVADAPLLPMNRAGLYLLAPYEALWRQNLYAAIIATDATLDRYQVIFAPQLHLATVEDAERLQAWVEAGGTLVVGPRAGVKNEANALHEEPQPGPLRALLGGTVREFDTREPGDTFELDFGDARVAAGVWAELWEPDEGTQVLATYGAGSGFYEGMPAILYRRHGTGQVITVGAMGGWKLYAHLLPLLGLRTPFAAPLGVEAVRRMGNGKTLLFLLNHNATPQRLALPDGAWRTLWGHADGGEVALPPYGAWVGLTEGERK